LTSTGAPYNRPGQPLTVTDASGLRTFTYAPEDQFPTGETTTGGLLAGFTRTVTPDTLRRPGLTALALGNPAQQSWTWNYDDASAA
jgi:YD repeat-containing protein